MNENYNTDYSKEEIELILKKIKDCIRINNFTISLNENREENKIFD